MAVVELLLVTYDKQKYLSYSGISQMSHLPVEGMGLEKEIVQKFGFQKKPTISFEYDNYEQDRCDSSRSINDLESTYSPGYKSDPEKTRKKFKTCEKISLSKTNEKKISIGKLHIRWKKKSNDPKVNRKPVVQNLIIYEPVSANEDSGLERGLPIRNSEKKPRSPFKSPKLANKTLEIPNPDPNQISPNRFDYFSRTPKSNDHLNKSNFWADDDIYVEPSNLKLPYEIMVKQTLSNLDDGTSANTQPVTCNEGNNDSRCHEGDIKKPSFPKPISEGFGTTNTDEKDLEKLKVPDKPQLKPVVARRLKPLKMESNQCQGNNSSDPTNFDNENVTSGTRNLTHDQSKVVKEQCTAPVVAERIKIRVKNPDEKIMPEQPQEIERLNNDGSLDSQGITTSRDPLHNASCKPKLEKKPIPIPRSRKSPLLLKKAVDIEDEGSESPGKFFTASDRSVEQNPQDLEPPEITEKDLNNISLLNMSQEKSFSLKEDFVSEDSANSKPRGSLPDDS